MNGDAGKGDTYRPVDWTRYAAGYTRAFGPVTVTRLWCPEHDQTFPLGAKCPICEQEKANVSTR